MTDWRTVCYLF